MNVGISSLPLNVHYVGYDALGYDDDKIALTVWFLNSNDVPFIRALVTILSRKPGITAISSPSSIGIKMLVDGSTDFVGLMNETLRRHRFEINGVHPKFIMKITPPIPIPASQIAGLQGAGANIIPLRNAYDLR